MLDLIKALFWEKPTEKIKVSKKEYEELQKQAITALAAPILSDLEIDQEIKKAWGTVILRQISYYAHYIYAQNHLKLSVPYVILKGTAAAQYYPHPEFRNFGDIDLMTRHEDFDIAYQQLINDGYTFLGDFQHTINFEKNGIFVELHRSFASYSEPSVAEAFDDLIIENINDSHLLPDLINGLVLIEHIYKHLRGGLGLRQIIDWMMFVNQVLTDEKWPEFEALIRPFNLLPLTIVATRMCEIYMGLPVRQWCAGADEAVCAQLMNYLLSSGNFGNKRTSDSDKTENVIAYAISPKALYRLLQRQGVHNWRAAKKYPFLRSFAWIYQMGRYIRRGLFRKGAFGKLKKEYISANERIDLFKAIGVNRLIDGPAIFQDGKYVRHDETL